MTDRWIHDHEKCGVRDCDKCAHHVDKGGQTGCEAWECEFVQKTEEIRAQI